MRPLKCWAWKPVCLWDGHKPVPGIDSRLRVCIICARCYKVLR